MSRKKDSIYEYPISEVPSDSILDVSSSQKVDQFWNPIKETEEATRLHIGEEADLSSAILSESTLAKDWLTPEEDEAWKDLDAKTPTRSPDDGLLSDLVRSIVEGGSPQFSSEMFVNKNFSWSEPKKKNRTINGSKLEFPRGVYAGQFTNVVPQFYNFNSIIDFIKTLDHSEEEDCDLPFCVRNKTQERFLGAAIGVAGGYAAGEPGYVCNIIWSSEKQRIYYDPFNDIIVKFSPKVIII